MQTTALVTLFYIPSNRGWWCRANRQQGRPHDNNALVQQQRGCPAISTFHGRCPIAAATCCCRISHRCRRLPFLGLFNLLLLLLLLLLCLLRLLPFLCLIQQAASSIRLPCLLLSTCLPLLRQLSLLCRCILLLAIRRCLCRCNATIAGSTSLLPARRRSLLPARLGGGGCFSWGPGTGWWLRGRAAAGPCRRCCRLG